MAAFGVHLMTTFVVIVTSLFIQPGNGERILKKMYIDLKTQSACFRILNGTHQFGCTSSMSGDVGTVHYIQDDSDVQWILSKGPHAPYVAVLNGENFTRPNVETLYQSDRVNGIMVINILQASSYPVVPEGGFSAVDKCPNDAYGLYSNHSDYKHCQKAEWNPSGSSLRFQDIGMPIFALTLPEDVDNILNKCYFPFNEPLKNKSRSYPVCSAEMKARMDAAKDSVTCIRRSNIFTLSFTPHNRLCDPLGDYNLAATIKETSHKENKRQPDSVILVGTRLDSTSLFQNENRGSDSSVAGFVTLLAAAEAFWKVKDSIQKDEEAKDVMFTFFQGESYDYIGSSRMVYDMNEGKFLGPKDGNEDSPTLYLPGMDLSHVGQFVELNQVGMRDDQDSLWIHTDPLTAPHVSSQVDKMIEGLKQFGQASSVLLTKADPQLPLPPASAQWFLKHRQNIPAVVLTDHQKEFTNKYYNSRLDTANHIDASNYPPGANSSVMYDFVTTQAQRITSLSTALSHYLYNASTGTEAAGNVSDALKADPMTVTHLLYCFLISPNCELFLESVDEDNANSLKTAKQPYSLYVSVDGHTTEVTTLVYGLLARFTGQRVKVSKGDCKAPSKDKRFSYVWMQGVKKKGSEDREGWCIRTTTFETKAVSPAFEIDGYDFDSGQYSTWTESVWGEKAFSVRLFLVPSRKFEITVLLVGLSMLLAALGIVYFLNRQSDIIFGRGRLRGTAGTYNPIL